MKKLNRFIKIDFICDNCQRKFVRNIVYSPAPNLEQLNDYSHYCIDCAVIVEKQNLSKKTSKHLIDKRGLRKTGRTHLFGTRVKKEWIKKLKSIARKKKLKYVEVLERALECYEKHNP